MRRMNAVEGRDGTGGAGGGGRNVSGREEQGEKGGRRKGGGRSRREGGEGMRRRRRGGGDSEAGKQGSRDTREQGSWKVDSLDLQAQPFPIATLATENPGQNMFRDFTLPGGTNPLNTVITCGLAPIPWLCTALP